jgi:hypothetical protein
LGNFSTSWFALALISVTTVKTPGRTYIEVGGKEAAKE